MWNYTLSKVAPWREPLISMWYHLFTCTTSIKWNENPQNSSYFESSLNRLESPATVNERIKESMIAPSVVREGFMDGDNWN